PPTPPPAPPLLPHNAGTSIPPPRPRVPAPPEPLVPRQRQAPPAAAGPASAEAMAPAPANSLARDGLADQPAVLASLSGLLKTLVRQTRPAGFPAPGQEDISF